MIPLRHRLVLAVSALAVVVAGCSGDEADAPAGPDSSSSADSPDGSEDPGGSEGADAGEDDTPPLPKAPKIVKPQGATEDVTMRGSCGLEPGEQDVVGRVKNPTKKSLDYVITVSWVSDDGRVRGRAVAVLDDVRPGAEKPWNATAEVGDDASSCVTNALRGRARS